MEKKSRKQQDGERNGIHISIADIPVLAFQSGSPQVLSGKLSFSTTPRGTQKSDTDKFVSSLHFEFDLKKFWSVGVRFSDDNQP